MQVRLERLTCYFIFSILIIAGVWSACYSETIIPGGDVSGVWDVDGSPYILTSSVRVENDCVLTILPGVEVRCDAGVEINVHNDQGLVAKGTRDSLVIFTSNQSNPSAGDWSGISLWGTENRSEFKHCIIEYARQGLGCRAWAVGCDDGDNYTKVDSCIFRYNSSCGLYLRGSGSSTSGCSFAKTGSCMAEITNNLIHDNGAGIDVVAYDGYYANGYVGATISNNVIFNNSGDGIYCHGDDPVEPKIINNTIIQNTANAISFINNFDPQDFHIINNIIAGNHSGIVAAGDSIPTVDYNDVWNNQNNYVNLAASVTDISADPLFANADSADFHLTEYSPCIDAGDPLILDPDNTVSDIGAFYFHHYTPPVAQFEADALEGLAPLTVNFIDKSTGDVDAWLWKFGDDSVSTLKNPIHTFQQEGSFTVTLIVSGPAGTDSLIKTDYITARPPMPPLADFTAAPTSGSVPLKVQFTNTSTGDIDSFLWDFGDGRQSSERHPLHEYKEEGKYTVSLTSSGPLGDDVMVKENYIVVQPSYDNLILNYEFDDELSHWKVLYLSGADFNLSIDKNSVLSGPNSVRFDIQSGGDEGWYIQLNQFIPVKKDYYYEISFKAKLRNATRKSIVVESLLNVSPYTNYFTKSVVLEDTIQTYGPFYVKSAITDSNARFRFQLGKTDNVIINIDSVSVVEYKIPPPPKVDFRADRQDGRAPLSVRFYNETVGVLQKVLWDFGDGTTSKYSSPSHIYREQGTYDVTLTAIGASGDTVSVTKPAFITVDFPTEVDDSKEVVHTFYLNQNYPNPFNSTTSIKYVLPESGHVKLSIFDVRGIFIGDLYNGRQTAGEHVFRWDPVDLSSGSYFIKLSAGSYTSMIKATLIK